MAEAICDSIADDGITHKLVRKLQSLSLRAQRGNLVAETVAIASTGLPRRYAPRNDRRQGLEYRNFLNLVRRYETAASSISKKLEHLFVRISSESDGIYWDRRLHQVVNRCLVDLEIGSQTV